MMRVILLLALAASACETSEGGSYARQITAKSELIGGQGAIGHLLLQLPLGQDAGVVVVEVLVAGSGLAAGGDNQYAVVQGFWLVAIGNGRAVVARAAFRVDQL
jgi:hypothetical protein